MKNFTTFLDYKSEEIISLVQLGLAIKNKTINPVAIKDKTLALIFFNPSLRTRISFEMAMHRFRGKALSLSAGSDVWNLEFEDGKVMDGSSVEHIKDGAKVISKYVDTIAVRSFASLKSIEEDQSEKVVNSFKKYSTVPVISMESAVEHPAQALADIMTIQERLQNYSSSQRLKFTLTWAPHIKALPMAVPHSAILAAACLGADIKVAHPPGFELNQLFLNHSKTTVEKLGGSLEILHDQKKSLIDADIIYAKSWGPSSLYGNPQSMQKAVQSYPNWIVDFAKIKNSKLLLHCLPVRRNLEVKDDALDSPISGIYDQAENRLWAQAGLLEFLFSNNF